MDFSSPPSDLAGYSPLAHAGECYWDAEEAARACDFFPRMLKHVEGPKAGEPLALEEWQAKYIATLFGWKRQNGTRRYRESLAAIPRKAGKSTLAAGIALYCLVCDGEAGAQVYSAAYSKDQASLVYRIAAGMVQRSPKLGKRLHAIDSVKRIVYKQANSFYRAIPAEAGNSHGFNASAVIFDELHTQKHRDLYDVLRSSQGARKQPLFLSITTAGYDRKSICYEVWNHARMVRDGILPDPGFLPLLYETADDADWQDEKVWAACNPNLGVCLVSKASANASPK
jgi:phage terminase large subunit-like protein